MRLLRTQSCCMTLGNFHSETMKTEVEISVRMQRSYSLSQDVVTLLLSAHSRPEPELRYSLVQHPCQARVGYERMYEALLSNIISFSLLDRVH